MGALTFYYYFFQLAKSVILLALIVAIFCVNLKVPGRTSGQNHENPNVCSCLQMPPLEGSPSRRRSQLGRWGGFAGTAEPGGRAAMEGAALSGGGWRAALALLFPLTLSRKSQRKPWEERKGNFNGGTVELSGKEAGLDVRAGFMERQRQRCGPAVAAECRGTLVSLTSPWPSVI